MEALGILLVPLGIAYLVAPIASFFMALNNRKLVNQLLLRIADLERKLVAGAAAPATAPPVADIPSAPVPYPPIAEAGRAPQPEKLQRRRDDHPV